MKPKDTLKSDTSMEADSKYLEVLINRINSGAPNVPEKSNDSRVEKLDKVATMERIKDWVLTTLGFGLILFLFVGMFSFAIETNDWSIFLVLPLLALITYPFYSRKYKHLPEQVKGLISVIILALLAGLTFVID